MAAAEKRSRSLGNATSTSAPFTLVILPILPFNSGRLITAVSFTVCPTFKPRFGAWPTPSSTWEDASKTRSPKRLAAWWPMSNQVCEATTWQSEHLPEKDNTFCVCVGLWNLCGYGSIPIDTFFSGMNIHLPAILGFTRYQGFDPSPCVYQMLHQVYCLHQSFWIFFLCTSNSRQIRLSSGVLQLSTNARDHFAR